MSSNHRWLTFKEYVQIHEHTMTHDEAIRWVFSVLGIMDNVDLHKKSQEEDINNALSSPLSAYPEKLEDLANQLQLKKSPNYPQIQALLANPDNATVSKLIATITSHNQKDNVSEPI